MDGAFVFGETCPQYLFLTRMILTGQILRVQNTYVHHHCEMFRHKKHSGGTLPEVLSALFLQIMHHRFDESGKFSNGRDVDFRNFANGMPGIEMRLPLMFSEGVVKVEFL